jgi:hypothetical protein
VETVQGIQTAGQDKRLEWMRNASFYASPASVALLVLNLFDGLFTMFFLQLAVAEELNPLMRVAYEQHPMIFMGTKMLVVNAGLLLLCLHRKMRASRLAIRAGAVVYAGINAWHLFLLTHLLSDWSSLAA